MKYYKFKIAAKDTVDRVAAILRQPDYSDYFIVMYSDPCGEKIVINQFTPSAVKEGIVKEIDSKNVPKKFYDRVENLNSIWGKEIYVPRI